MFLRHNSKMITHTILMASQQRHRLTTLHNQSLSGAGDRGRSFMTRTLQKLLQLCRSLGLYIINGRLRGDTLGRFTFCSPLGKSTVDYMITDKDPSSLRSFTVRELTPLSDHSQITAYLKKTENNINTKPSKLYNIRNPYRWAENSAEEYQKALSSQKIQALIDNFLQPQIRKSWDSMENANKKRK